jgi:SAM-dependent methyltransferase
MVVIRKRNQPRRAELSAYDRICNAQPDYRLAMQSVANQLSRCFPPGSLGAHPDLLDLGCGTGECLRRLREAGLCVNATGVDSAAGMLEIAKKKAPPGPGAPTIDYVLGDAVELLSDCVGVGRKWDVMVSTFTLHNWSRVYRDRVLPLIHSALRPGGWLLMADYYPREPGTAVSAFRAQILTLFDILAPCADTALIARWMTHTIEDMGRDRVMYEPETLRQLRDIGFVDVTLDRISELTAVVFARRALSA